MLFIGDPHCGSVVGLTPPRMWGDPSDTFYAIRRESWNWFEKTILPHRAPDVLAFNADMIDGNGERSGGTEEITTDRLEQCAMVVEILNLIQPKKIIATFGTGYHTGSAEDFEKTVLESNKLNFKTEFSAIESHAFFRTGGVLFSMKHHIGTSSIPHGRASALLREGMWNALLAEIEQEPRADVIVRSHAHYYMQVDDGNRLGFILPALQGRGTKYGARRCSGATAFGIVTMNCENGEKEWKRHLLQIQAAKPVVHQL